MSLYALGQPVRVSVTITNFSGVLVNPATLTLTVKKPDGTQQSYASPVNDSTGQYHQDIPSADLTQTGGYLYEWVSTGTGAGATGDSFEVYDPLAPAESGLYCTVDELKNRLGVTDTADDLEFQTAVQAAARGIEGFCGRYFWQAADTRTYVPDTTWTVHTDDLVSVTSLKVDTTGNGTFDQTWLASDYELALAERQYNLMSSGEQRPYREIRVVNGGSKFFPFVWPLYHQDRIQVTGVFGWPAIPPMVKQAALQLSADYFKMKDAPWGIAGFSDFGIVKVQAGSQLALMLQPYIDPRRKVGV